MTSPREPARQIAEEIDQRGLLTQFTRSVYEIAPTQLSDIALLVNYVASLTADLAQAQQERDAAQRAMAYSSEQAHLEWTRANKAEGDLAAAEQARDEALKVSPPVGPREA